MSPCPSCDASGIEAITFKYGVECDLCEQEHLTCMWCDECRAVTCFECMKSSRRP